MGLHRAQSFFDVEFLENGLLLRDIDIQIGREKIQELFRVLDAPHDQAGLVRRIWRQFQQARR